jgi:hypothetical protein
MCDRRNRFDVCHLRRWIGNGLGMDQLRVRAYRFAYRSEIADVHERRFDTVPLRQQLTKKTPDSLIRYIADHNMIATFQESEEYRMQRSNARAENGCVLTALHCRKLALEPKLIVARIAGIEQRLRIRPVE